MKEKSIYDELSEERKHLQNEGKLPAWVTTLAWQMLKEKYLTDEYPDLQSVYSRIAKHASTYTDNPELWESKFFQLFWNGWLAASTPVLANMGTNFGCPVSCSGQVIGDSVYSFYESQKETAILSKNGFGTSGYLGDIGALNQIIHLWKFDDEADRRAFWNGVFSDPEFMNFAKQLRPLLQNQENKLMLGAPWGPQV